jgi:hypothetical protein
MAPVTTALKSGPSLLMLYSMMFAVPRKDEAAATAVVVAAAAVLGGGVPVAAVAQPATAPSTAVPTSAAALAWFIG